MNTSDVAPMSPAGDQFTLHPSVTPAVQLRTLQRLFAAVDTAVIQGLRPVVEIDLDLCALMPRYRTMEALRQVGIEFDIREFREPAGLPILPGYSDEAWLAFVQRLELELKHPRWSWIHNGRANRQAGTPFARFHGLYWTTDWLIEDTPTPGLGSLVHAIVARGGQVVFLSGRWLTEQISPTRQCLKRGGVPEPALIIGNPWHETLVSKPGDVLSDAQVKRWRQAEILRQYGAPIAIIDDRATNRAAVIAALAGVSPGVDVLSVGVAIPGFTSDPAVAAEPLRLSTFERFSETSGHPPVRPHFQSRYPGLGAGQPWRGLYEGVGRNNRPYVLPRLAAAQSGLPSSAPPPYESLLRTHAPGSLTEDQFIDACEDTIPRTERDRLRTVFAQARALAEQQLADSFPADSSEQRSLWLSLVCAWLHSRDIESVMHAIGFPLKAAGVHDIEEWVNSDEIIQLLLPTLPPLRPAAAAARYDEWLLRWGRTLSPGQPINVGYLNPALLVSLWRWHPEQATSQDAMDVHRLADHHHGDRQERYDPIEAAINNLLHRREGLHGVRKEPIESWAELIAATERETGAEVLAKDSAGRGAARDGARIGRELERAGFLTPWGLVCGAGV